MKMNSFIMSEISADIVQPEAALFTFNRIFLWSQAPGSVAGRSYEWRNTEDSLELRMHRHPGLYTLPPIPEKIISGLLNGYFAYNIILKLLAQWEFIFKFF